LKVGKTNFCWSWKLCHDRRDFWAI